MSTNLSNMRVHMLQSAIEIEPYARSYVSDRAFTYTAKWIMFLSVGSAVRRVDGEY